MMLAKRMVSSCTRCAAPSIYLAQPLPVLHVVVVHRLAPAEDVVLDEEVDHHGHGDVDHRDVQEGGELGPELRQRHAALGAQRLLHQVVEAAEPVVDLHVQLHPVPRREQDQDGAQDGPRPPAPGQEEGSEHRCAFVLWFVRRS
jgi:hypothetical protein